MSLNKEQSRQVKKQLLDHRHERHEVDIDLDARTTIGGFIVFPNVLRPDRVIGVYLARYLYSHSDIYKGRIVIDMGSGSGLQGIVTGIYGAKQVIFSDISIDAFENTKENVKKFKLEEKSKVYKGNLFEKIADKADVIVFNHPFFPDKPIANEPVSVAIMDEGKLLSHFLSDAKVHLNENGSIIMPYYHLAGPINDPMIHTKDYGYSVKNVFECDVPSGLRIGVMSIYELKL